MKKISIVLIIVLALAGCGQAGPLYLPDPAQSQSGSEESQQENNEENS